MKATLAKPLALTTSLLMLPVLGSLLVFGNGPQPMSIDVTVLPAGGSSVSSPEAGAATSPETSAGTIGLIAPSMGASSRVSPSEGAVVAPRFPELLERSERRLELYQASPPERFYRPNPARNTWTPSQAEVKSTLERKAREAEAARAMAQVRLAKAQLSSPEEVAELVRYAYAEGAPEVARDLQQQTDMLISFQEAPVSLEMSSHFRRRTSGGGDLELSLVRSADYDRPLVVTFPPGTYGESVSRSTEPGSTYRHFPKAQDLAFLRAPVVVFRPGQARAQVTVPVACASYGVNAPVADHPYELTRFERGSDVEKLMVNICAGDEKDDSEAQLAVWVARNDIERGHFLGRAHRLRTFHEHSSIGSEDIRGAARLLLGGGVDPHRMQFFPRPAGEKPASPTREESREDPAPGPSPASAEPTPAPEPRLPVVEAVVS